MGTALTNLKDADLRTVQANPFSGKTATEPRPSAGDPRYRFHDPDRLRQVQDQWDQADAWRKERERFVAEAARERQAKLDAQAGAAQAKRDERLARERERTMDALRARFLAVPGTTPEMFERKKDELFEQYAMEQALSGDLDRANRARGLVDARTF